MKVLVFLLIIAVYLCINIYLAYDIYRFILLFLPPPVCRIMIAVFFIAAMSVIVSLFIPSELVSDIGAVWMGVFVYLLLFTVIKDILLICGKIIKLVQNPTNDAVQFFCGIFVLLLTVSVTVYGIYHATDIKTKYYNIKCPKAAEPIKIALISDIHLGAMNSEKRLPDIVQSVNDVNPDVVCISGDIFDNGISAVKHPEFIKSELRKINSVYGTYACLGNHDGGSSFSRLSDFLSKCNITLLNDESIVIGQKMLLVGRIDSRPIRSFGNSERKGISYIIKDNEKSLPVIVMEHNPSHINEYGIETDLILCGHTHKGQIFPAGFVTNMMFETDYGYYRKSSDSPQVIVSSGAGTWGMPMRIGTDSEIVCITLS